MAKLMKKLSKFFLSEEADGKIKNGKEIGGETRKVEERGGQQAENHVGERKIKTAGGTDELKNRGKLFVGGLGCQTTSKGLEAYFSQFGKVIDAVVMRFPSSGRSRGFGFVMFAQGSDAESALRSDSHVLDGRNIDVRPFVSGEHSSNASRKEKDYKVFLGGLPDSVSTDVLKQFFERYGEVSRTVIPLDRNTKKPKGFGFIWFKNEEAVEKCLAEDFVHLGGRRIHIKKAGPRSTSHVPDAIEATEIGPYYQEVDDFSLEDMYLWDKKSTSSVVDNENSSATSGEKSEEELKLQNWIENFFSSKVQNFTAANEMKAEEEEQNFEKLLNEFLVSCSKEYSVSNENLISFSGDSESEESTSGTHSDCDSDDGDNDYGANGENDTEALDHLNTEFMEMLRGNPWVRDTEISDLNIAGRGDDRDFQTSVPFKFRDSNGSLFCPLCQWAPKDNSSECFLIHCRTASHRMKLKERFPRERSEVTKQTEGKKQIGKTNSRPKPAPQKPSAVVQQGISKSQGKTQAPGKGEKQNQTEQQQKAVTTVKNTAAKGVKKGGNVEIKNTPSNSKSEENKNKSYNEKSVKGLKMMALAKGMSCIQPVDGEQLKCKMCNKVIPQAPDFNVVMKNVSHHLQSKGHLKKLLETENLMKESLEKNQKKTKSDNHAKNPASQKSEGKDSSQEQKASNQKTQSKAASQEQKVSNQKTQSKAASQEQKASDQKTQSKAASQEQKVFNQMTQDKAASHKQKISNQGNAVKDNAAKKSQDKNSDPKLYFFCIPCNYKNKDIELFKTHLKSESHIYCFTSKGVRTDLSLDNLSKCNTCELFLYGSLYYINKHYSKCLEKKGWSQM